MIDDGTIDQFKQWGQSCMYGSAETNLKRGRGEFILGLVEFKKSSRCLGKHLGFGWKHGSEGVGDKV